MEVRINQSELELLVGDITEMETDAIVNPANHLLKLGGGVAGAIARKGGPMIQRECDALGGTPVGTAALTGAGELPMNWVIHAVGPRMGEGEEEEKIAAATEAVFEICAKKGIPSVSFPAISTGVFGVPMELSAEAMLGTAVARLRRSGAPSLVVFCLYDLGALGVFEATLKRLMEERGSHKP
ncbi:MAG: macro domain-containing protein [Planctomycetes bacterium]|nr:macro domain-containing protein [Planctomycetota bacterium]